MYNLPDRKLAHSWQFSPQLCNRCRISRYSPVITLQVVTSVIYSAITEITNWKKISTNVRRIMTDTEWELGLIVRDDQPCLR